jgi:hypothetical protein
MHEHSPEDLREGELERQLLFDMEGDNELAQAIAMAHSEGIDVSEALRLPEEDKFRWRRYLTALRAVMETREGQIVLRHWLDASCAFDRVYTNNAGIYRTAALKDYASDRLEEVALAGQKLFYELLHQGHRNRAFDHVLKRRRG